MFDSRRQVKSREEPIFIRLSTSSHLPRFGGAAIALVWVGQRDTKWLVPLTVSSGYQGEEGNHTYQALHIPTIVAPFIFFHLQMVWPAHDCGLVKDCG